ncbi:MAG: menaquinone biosynthesis protein [Bacteroidetes bacterium]|nr:menaquinone biosynthesis protein [Bacteroidota bacterium]
MQKKYSISIVNYLNTLPFVYGLQQHKIDEIADLQFDIPAVCAEKLLTKKVDIGLVPVAILAKMDSYRLLTDFCIGTTGVVDSVKLFSTVPLNEIKTILLDYQSKTSVELVKILARDYWKISADFVDAEPGFESQINGNTAAVIIGDRTFSINNTFAYEYDLAAEWKKLTGLPFAFAVWASHEKIEDREFLKAFNNALKFGVEHIDEALASHTNKHPNFDPKDYLNNKISYKLDSEKLRAIDLFIGKII